MSQHAVISSPSASEDTESLNQPSVLLFSKTPSEVHRILGWFGLVTGCGFAILGFLIVLAFVPGMTPKEYTPGITRFGYCLGGFLMLIGAAMAKLVIPSAFGWARTFTWHGNRLIAAHGRKSRTVFTENITGLTVGRRASSPIVVTIAGDKSLEISRSLPQVEKLVALIEATRPVAAEQVSSKFPPKASSPETVTQSTQSHENWDQLRAQTMERMNGETMSMSTDADTTEPPLWCIQLLTGGLAFVGMAFYLHRCLFAQIATGERSLDSCWFGYAMLYEFFGPTLAIYVIGGTGLLLTVGGMIGIGATCDKRALVPKES